MEIGRNVEQGTSYKTVELTRQYTRNHGRDNTDVMRFSYLENGMIALSALLAALMVGFFYTYSFNVNLAMLEVDGEMYAIMQSLFNENVRHAGFFVVFFGAGVMPLVALAVNWRHYRTPSFWLIAVAAVVYILGVIVFTRNVNLPLNYYTESWNPQALPADWTETRDAWNRANAVRVATSGVAFVLHQAALVLRASVRG